ncbi:hypothetical protein BSL78_04661 [Apostichopus japonicus]|uniref:Uncharacterized protein n=1 Tax=Stichopus japonicus TaxID=307972 RepID=A0A2G8LE62_STIJA|nr:hypothetical protein BSL78_04661 [Apostichopus japonicus]
MDEQNVCSASTSSCDVKTSTFVTSAEYCPLPLGLKEDFYDRGRRRRGQPGIQDRAISASSYSDESFHPRFVRYDSRSCWKNSSDDSEPWIQVDFEDLHIITGIVLQACEETGWVEEFTIQSKRAVNAYITHRDRTTGRRVFSGNVNSHCARVIAFDPWIYAESIRVIPISWNTEVGLRFELLGCQEDCDYALGLTDLSIFDAAITASSLLDDLHPPRSARIQPLGLQFESRLGWSPDLEADGGVPSWIQVNFPYIQVMKAVITQGCKESNSYLETFTIDYTIAADADDNDDIHPYTRPGSDEYLIFHANTDSETLVRNDLPFQVRAQFVRVNAISWGGSGPPCMKFEIIGCAYEICGQSLGIGKGTLGETISTSSSGACSPETYKLHGNNTFSFSNVFSTTERIIEGTLEITLPEEYSITGIVTQGALLLDNSEASTWATKYRLLYSRGVGDGNDFRDRPYVSSSGAQKEFDANYDSITPVFNELDRPIAATSLKLIIYNHEVVSLNYPCIRFDLIGCKVSERGFPCGSSAQELGGYCMGSVEGGTADPCVDIFHSSSHEAILSQPNTLAEVISNFLQLLLPGYTHYLIGLIHVTSRPFNSSLAPFVWLDGTPLLDISEFDPDIDYQNSTEQLCVTIDLTDQLSWKALPCDSAAIVPASLCQFDIDECLQDTYVCSHGCINYPGGYQCSCPEGMYLEPGPGQESCRSICEVLGLSLSSSLPDSCIEFHSGSDFETANRDCQLTGKRLMTANELLSVTSEWIGVFSLSSIWVSPTDRLDTDCYVADLGVSLGEVQVLNTPCRSNVTFICVQDDLPPTFELVTSYNTTNYTVSDNSLYIIWTGFAPWFGTLTSANLDIRVEEHLILRVYFVYSNLRRQPFPGSGCLDWLVLWENLPNGRRRRQGEYCSELSDFNLESTTNHITLSLMVDDFVPNMPNYITLQLLYESRDCSIQECNIYCASADQNYTAPQGQLQTFNFPEILPPYYSCSWTIWLEPGSFVRLQFLEVNIACTERHRVNIFSRRIPGKNRLDMKHPAILCQQTEAITISERNSLVITYDTGLTQRSGGFQAVYETSDIPGCRLDPKEDIIEGCSETRCKFPRAYIASPNFPSPYGEPFICHWIITTAPGTFISLKFLEFDIPDDISCVREYIAVEDSEQVKRFCNANTTNEPIPAYHSSRNEVLIRFSSVGRFLALYEQMYFTSSTPLVLASDNDYYCPNGWYLYNKRCFSIENSNIEIRWTEAVSLCSRKNNRTQAVSIRNVGEANFIHDLILNKVSKSLIFYIGLFKSEDRFRWTDDSPLSYTDWYQREYNYDEIQPDGGQIEACSAIFLRNFGRSDNWFDVPCAARSTNYYICARPAITDSPPDRMKRISFHTEDCRGGYFRISQRCLRLISTNNSSRSSDSGDLCPGASSAVPKQFVLSNLMSIQFHLNYIWSIPDGEIEIQTMRPNNFELTCFQKGPVRGFELKTGSCNASQTFGLCSLATTDIVQVCADNQFRCDTGECINPVFVCDFISDCSDGSDESSCVQGDSLGLEATCGPSQFKCRDNICIQTSFLCDFKSDCPDGSDEDNCVYPDCLDDEFLCDNKQCIPLSGYCNLIEDCVDGSDEVFCVTAEGNFQCYSSVWLPRIAYCDGHRDCVGQGYEDEPRDCDYFGSGFSCNSTNDVTCKSGACTRKRNLCLMEENEYGFMNGCRDLTHLQNCERFECTGLTYKCPDSYCIPQHYRCNDIPDCPGKEDELNCKNYICEGAYRCRDSPSCLAQQFVCDGIKQCPNGDDELFCEIDCPDNCTCSGLTYFCLNVIWSAEHVAGIPRNIKQLSLTNLQLSGRSKRQAIDGAVTILDATFLNIPEFSLLYSFNYNNNTNSYRIPQLNDIPWTGKLKRAVFFLSLAASRSERFYYCCLLEDSTTLQECLPQPDEFSSCTDLIRSTLQRIVIWLMALSSLSGNIIVILLRLFKRKKPATRRGNTAQPLFIMNLAIADLLMGCYLLMITVADISYRGRYGLFSDIWQNSFFCRLAGFLSTISSVTSVYSSP